MSTVKTPLFPLGQVLATPGALGLGVHLGPYLNLHKNGYWGDICKEDWQENDRSLKEGYRLFSAYETSAGKIWIITEHDRSVTTVLLPEEY